MTDETVVVKKRGRKAASEAAVQDTLPLESVPVEAPVVNAPVVEPAAAVQTPEDILKPIVGGATITPATPTMVQFVGTMIPKGMWQLVPLKADVLGIAWNVWKDNYGAGDPERFLRTVYSLLGMALDGALKTVWSLKLE